MSRLRARCPACRTLTAIPLGDDYECHACGRVFGAGLVRVPRAWGKGGEAMVAAARLSVPYPEVAVIEEETLEEQSRALAAALPSRPLVLGGCCCAHVGAAEGLAARAGRLGLVWLDAHGDLNTPETSPSGNAWGMPLRMLLDGGAVALRDAVLVGARNLDPAEREFIAATGLRLGVESVDAALAGVEAVYVALDGDVIDPGEGIDVSMPEPEGLALAEVEELLRQIVASRRPAGAGLTGFTAAGRNLEPMARLCAALGLQGSGNPNH